MLPGLRSLRSRPRSSFFALPHEPRSLPHRGSPGASVVFSLRIRHFSFHQISSLTAPDNNPSHRCGNYSTRPFASSDVSPSQSSADPTTQGVTPYPQEAPVDENTFTNCKEKLDSDKGVVVLLSAGPFEAISRESSPIMNDDRKREATTESYDDLIDDAQDDIQHVPTVTANSVLDAARHLYQRDDGTLSDNDEAFQEDNWNEKKVAKMNGERYINSIMMNEYVSIPGNQDMKILKNVFDLESEKYWNIIVRTVTEKFWETAIDVAEAKRNRRVCAVGTPGIGKSKSTAILIRLLLQQNRTVVYHVRTMKESGWVYQFKPIKPAKQSTHSSIAVSVIRENEFRLQSTPSLWKETSNFYVVDPGQTIDNCCPPDAFKGNFILVSSPDESHWGGREFIKERAAQYGTFLYYPLWSLEELLKFRPYIREDISDDEVVERYRQVGGVPRHIFANHGNFKEVLLQQTTAVLAVTDAQLESIARNEWSLVQTKSSDQPKSLIMGYGCSGENFDEINAEVISDTVIEKILDKHKSFLWSRMMNLGVDRGGLGWRTFEMICRNLMIRSKEYTSRYTECVGKSTRKANSNLQREYETVSLGGCKSIKLTHGNIVQEAKETPMVVFYSAKTTYKLIDFAYQKENIVFAFQVTIGQRHDATVNEIRNLAKTVGGPEFLHLYYLVPHFNFNNFFTNPVDPIVGIKSLINADLRKERDNERKRELRNELQGKWTINVLEIKDPRTEDPEEETTPTESAKNVAMAHKGTKDDDDASDDSSNIPDSKPVKRRRTRR